MAVILSAVSIVSSLIILPAVMEFVAQNGKLVENYRHRKVHTAGGVFFTLNIYLLCGFLAISNFVYYNDHDFAISISVILTGVLSASFSGYIDDNTNDTTRGILGHLKSLFHRKYTSGCIKAVMGVLASVIICTLLEFNFPDIIINAAIICLMQNFINMLDLRPLRAVKGYLAFSLISLPFLSLHSIYTFINLSVIISLIFYMRYESREICMMGDTGSNTLGILMGIIIISSKSIVFRSCVLFILIFAQLYGERKSISILIENNRALKYLDDLGRRNLDDKDKEGNNR